MAQSGVVIKAGQSGLTVKMGECLRSLLVKINENVGHPYD